MSYKILVIEDDRGLNQGIRLALKKEEFTFEAAYSIKDALKIWQRDKPDMILLDVNLPDGNGFDFLHTIRCSCDIPVLIITANDMETDEVTGLSLGADDYITKPFSLMALRARVDNIRRRTSGVPKHVYEMNGFRFDFENLDFRVNEQEISLSTPEQKLLKLFVTHPGVTLPREMLTENIWALGMEFVDENALSVTISRLRKKLENKDSNSPIHTVYGIGYVWKLFP